jgi:FkbM family methyltransferase
MKVSKEELTNKILKRYELYKLNHSRWQRFLKDPFRSAIYYAMQYLAYIKPYKVNYTTLWGDKMNFFLPEGGAIYYYGFFEANLNNFFIKYLQKGDTFVDIGAHVGFYSKLASFLLEGTGEIISLEPTPRTFETLRQNMSSDKNARVFNYAALDTESTVEFYDYGPKFSAFNSFHERTNDDIYFKNEAHKISAETVVIDTFCQKENIKPIIIKIDAEGAEHLILQGMRQIIHDYAPTITIEVAGESEWKDNCSQSIDFLLTQGYEMYEIDINGMLHTHKKKESYLYDNLVFVHPKHLNRIDQLLVK